MTATDTQTISKHNLPGVHNRVNQILDHKWHTTSHY